MTPIIRRGESSDLPAIRQLLDKAGLPTSDLTTADGIQTWVFEASPSLVAVIGLERSGEEALLRSLAVTPEHRGRGLGRELVARVERDANAGGVARLVLLTQTAEAFFRDLGYSVTDRRNVSDGVKQSAEFRSLCPASAVCMSKALQP